MNTNPVEAKLALWLEDELEGEQLAEFEVWVAGQPEHLAAREKIRGMRRVIASAIPAAEEPPHLEFFTSRISRVIRNEPHEPVVPRVPRISWQSLLMPLAACAGMALAFLVGVKTRQSGADVDVAGAPRAIPVEPIVYTPESGVKAEWFASTKASATVIVLNGVQAIPDATDFTETTAIQNVRESDATADVELEGNEDQGL